MLTWCLFSVEIHEGSTRRVLRFLYLPAGRERAKCVYTYWRRTRECRDQTAGIAEIPVMPGMSQRHRNACPVALAFPAPETGPVLREQSKRFRLLRVLFSIVCCWNDLNSLPFPSFPHMNSALKMLQGAVCCYDQSFWAGTYFHSD